MSYARGALLLLSLLVSAQTASAITLVKASTLKAKPASCSAFLSDTAAPVTSYAATDTFVALYFVVSGHKAGDIASVDYIQPDGKANVAASGPWSPLTADDVGGQFCFSDVSLRIAGASPALQTGQWSAKIYYNSVLIATLNFTIGSTTPTPSGTNLLKNPGAEDGPISPDYSGLATIPGWTTDRNVAVIAWSNTDYLGTTAPGPTDRGKNFFSGGYSSTASMSQVVDVSSAATAIDAGTQPYTLSGWLGGWSGQDDNATLTATFKDASGATLGTAKIGPVIAADRKSESGLLYRSTSANLPARTRSVTIIADFFRSSGSSNDGYADNLNFSLSSSGGTSCTYSISPTSATIAASGGSGQVQVTTAAGCQWTMQPNASWIALGSFSTSGTGSGTVSYTVQPNTTTASRTGTITIAGQTFTVTQAAPAATCTYNVTLSPTTIAAAGGTARAEIGTTSGCQWTAASDATWARPSVTNGSGNSAVTFTVDANTTTSSRTARLTIAGVVFTLTQSAATSNCTYNVTLSPTAIAAAGGTARAQITTTSACQWTAASDASWATLSATSGSGGSTVTITVAANNTTSARTARLTIAGVSFTLTQAASTPANCTYTVSPAKVTLDYEAQYGFLEIKATASSCKWTASSSDPWLIIPTEYASGAGNATITYEVTENTAEARSATLTVAGYDITVSQAANPSKAGPAPTVVNAASRMPATLAAGAIARGAIFSVLAPQIGPKEVANAATYPLETTLAGVTVKVTQGDLTFDAYPIMASASQVDAILPSSVAEGDASLTVTFDGKTSDPIQFKIVTRNFGAFTAYKGSGPAKIQLVAPDADPIWISRLATAKPNQEVVLWGTGLGPVDGGDNVLPTSLNLVPDAQVTVAGKTAQVLYAGRSTTAAGQDVIRFIVPADTPSGCFVPVQVNLAGVYSNIVTMAIQSEGKECSDPTNPFSGILTNGRKGGSIFLLRGNFVGVLDPEKGVQDATLDLGLGLFVDTPGGGDQAFNPLVSMPPPGSCSAYTGVADPNAASGLTSGDSSALGKILDAGETITLTHPSGQTVTLEGPAADEEPGAYSGFFGGNVPGSETGPKPLFFTPGVYRVTGTGGRDVGPFDTKVTIPAPVDWTNKADLTTLDRAAGITFNWSTPTSPQRILLGAAATDQTTKAAAGFFCVVPGGTGTFAVPPNILANLPPTVDPDPKKSGAVLIFGTLPGDDITRFTAKGIDLGQIFYGMLGATLVQIK